MLRLILAYISYKTGFRFSKDYRYGTTAYHRAVYAILPTVRLNQLADALERDAESYKRS